MLVRMRIRSLALLSGLGSSVALNCIVGHRCGCGYGVGWQLQLLAGTPSLRTSTCCKCSPKKKKKQYFFPQNLVANMSRGLYKKKKKIFTGSHLPNFANEQLPYFHQRLVVFVSFQAEDKFIKAMVGSLGWNQTRKVWQSFARSYHISVPAR